MNRRLWDVLPVAASSSFLSCQQLRTNNQCSRQPEVSGSLQPLCCCRALNQFDETNHSLVSETGTDLHGTPIAQVNHLFLPEGGPQSFRGRSLQNWFCLFFLYEQQRIHGPYFLLFYRTKQVAAVFLSHHSPTLCFLALFPEYLNIPRLLNSTFD